MLNKVSRPFPPTPPKNKYALFFVQMWCDKRFDLKRLPNIFSFSQGNEPTALTIIQYCIVIFTVYIQYLLIVTVFSDMIYSMATFPVRCEYSWVRSLSPYYTLQLSPIFEKNLIPSYLCMYVCIWVDKWSKCING